ncbi:diaminohydroxyphosphoribosylamino-pyrimidine deaminase [Guyanagaster necrorhizus]|uniref:Diaminohydroxyphosphoribosylamino-pyrimidine deaminase n=1 Tax=Guyanagaster necrorhizus TaxID=856835 RepID=A0A9P7W5B3_9AGAR|nr:diaminohydroxyphosphoribosylamino-pyrimidine deaminase [Guyanagaster necrorhizus MCA 3950]KAG7452427.1 diaminohydroxyphosphoribosylamino-pyrimidine deaminase [Guyanagaster necrorhizus MCA 3950]
MSTDVDEQVAFMRLALAEAEKCQASPTAFCVGCVLVLRWPDNGTPAVVSTGYSRELEGNTHAEANALTKLHSLPQDKLCHIFSASSVPFSLDIGEILARLDVYTTMEPCSIRTSGLAPCADALIAAKIKRCFIGVGEPADFVTCEGAQKLKDAGIEVVWVEGLEEESLRVARRGH